MQVSGIGAGAAASGTVASGSTLAQSSVGSNQAVGGSVPVGMQSLVETLGDFNSAQILMALMLLAASGKQDDERSCGEGAGMAFLAGLAVAGQLGQSTGLEGALNSLMPAASASFDGLGLQMDVQA